MTTLWDAIEAGDNELLIQVAPTYGHLDPAFNAVRPSMTVRAPCCGRRRSADCVTDVRNVPGTWIRAHNNGPWTDPDWLCDQCCEYLYMTSVHDWTRSKFARAMGRPHRFVRELRARELLVETDTEGKSVTEIAAILRSIHEGLPSRGNVPGTERPVLPSSPQRKGRLR